MPRFGVSFVPDGQNGNDPQRPGGGPTDRYQEAVKILSLRLPKMRGAMGGIAPSPLLNASGAMGQPQTAMGGGQPINSEVAQAFLQMAGMGQPGQRRRRPQGLQAGPRPQQAGPRVIPGIDTIPGGLPEIPNITREWDQPTSTFDVPSPVPQEFPTMPGGPEPVSDMPAFNQEEGGGGDTLYGQDGLNYFDLLRRRMNGGY